MKRRTAGMPAERALAEERHLDVLGHQRDHAVAVAGEKRGVERVDHTSRVGIRGHRRPTPRPPAPHPRLWRGGVLPRRSGSGTGIAAISASRVGLVRAVEHRVDRPVFDDASAVHDQHAIGDLAHRGEVVGDEQVGHPELALQLGEQVEQRQRAATCRAPTSARRGRRRSGRVAIARAMPTRCFWPPLSWSAAPPSSAGRAARSSISSRSRSSDLVAAAIPCSLSGSRSVCRTVMLGFRLACGSWKTIWMLRRSGRKRRRATAAMSCSRNSDRAPRRVLEPHEAARGRGLAAAALADERECLARAGRRMTRRRRRARRLAVARRNSLAQPLDAQQRGRCSRSWRCRPLPRLGAAPRRGGPRAGSSATSRWV